MDAPAVSQSARLELKAAKRLLTEGRAQDAVAALKAAPDLERDADLLRLLAKALGRLEALSAEEEAWARLLALVPDDPEALARLTKLQPSDRTPAASARRLAGEGLVQAAALKWRRVLDRAPHDLEAQEQLEQIALYDAPRAPAVSRGAVMRIGVLGNCQAYGFARRLRRLCPQAQVRAVGLAEISSVEQAQEIATRWSDLDVVITQLVLSERYGPLRTEPLRERARRVAFFPRIAFRGFHPDVLPAAWPRGRHSALALAGYVVGLSQARTAELFNAYVYGALGYFDEYARAERLHLQEAAALGLDLEPMLRAWRVMTPFVHVPNHPRIEAFDVMAETVADELGLERAPAPPEDHDPYAAFGAWPVYPEIARRLGVAGSLSFRFAGEPVIDLEGMIARAHRSYESLDLEALHAAAAATVAVLRREGI